MVHGNSDEGVILTPPQVDVVLRALDYLGAEVYRDPLDPAFLEACRELAFEIRNA